MLFEKLNEDRKLQEITKCRDSESYLDYDWWEFVDEDFKTILELLGFYRINTSFSGFGVKEMELVLLQDILLKKE